VKIKPGGAMMGRKRTSSGIARGLLVLALHVATVAPAHALRHVFLGAQIEGHAGVPLTVFTDIAVTPDGSHAYTTQDLSGSLWLFNRDPLTGALTFVGPKVVSNGTAAAIQVSPDGAHVYWLGLGNIRGFSRNPTTGDLTFVNEIYASAVPEPTGRTCTSRVSTSERSSFSPAIRRQGPSRSWRPTRTEWRESTAWQGRGVWP
jgi:hypothetical protein